MAKKTDLRTFNVSVIGLSGTEKGQVGVGKSCLCNRFICTSEDHYGTDHISVLSQSDFGGRVINNDHFLYWGQVTKMDDGSNFLFNVIEQTEFIDDVSFSLFKTGRTDPYTKRSVQTKVQSAEKLMYICKDQLGMETDYEQKVMPDGKLHIDGFLCCFDVSVVAERSIEKQVEFCIKLLNNAMKTKKPVVLVTTKNDDLNADYLKEVDKLLLRKEYKNNLQLVETSAHENVNVEAAFLVLAHMMDKSKSRKITPFSEARKAKNEWIKVATESFNNLLRSKIIDSKVSWEGAQKQLQNELDFQNFVDLFGTEKVRTEVKSHIHALREELIKQKQNIFMRRLPDLLQRFLPDLELIGERADWVACQMKMMENKDFGSYFKNVCEDGKSWKDSDIVDEPQVNHLPVDILNTKEAESCFRNHINELQAARRKEQLRQEFRASLEKNVDVPGGNLADYYQLFAGKECFTGLEERERKLLFDDFQQQLKQRLRTEFQELLWERPGVFYNLNLDPKTNLTEEDLNVSYNSLNDDQRFRKFYKLEDDRRVMLLNHVVFLDKPSVDHCVFHSPTGGCKCTECQVSNILQNQRHFVPNGRTHPRHDSGPLVQPLNLLILGIGNLAAELHSKIQGMCMDNEYRVAQRVYSLNYRVIDADVDDHTNALVTPNFKPHGCVCVYNSSKSLEYIRLSLLKIFKSCQSSAAVQVLVVMLAYEPYSQKECENIRADGKLLATSLQCEFVDIPAEVQAEKPKFYPKQIEKALNTIIRASGPTDRDKFLEDNEPDLRLLICMMCSDPFPMEIPIQPFLNDDSFAVTNNSETSSINSGKDTVFSINATINDVKQKVEITVTSYHGGHCLLKKHQLYHGYILVYCPKRQASLFSVKALACAVEAHGGGCLLFLAVPEGGDSKSGVNDQGIKDGQELARIKSASFMQTSSNFKSQGAMQVYGKFLQDTWDQKKKLANICNGHQESTPLDHDYVSISCVPEPLPTLVSDQTVNHHSSYSPSTEEEPEKPLYDKLSLPEPPAEPQHTSPSPSLLPRSSPPPVKAVFEYRNNYALVKPSMLKARRDEDAAWALNDPKRYPKTVPPRVLSMSISTKELPSNSPVHSDDDDQTKLSQNDFYDRISFASRSKVLEKSAIYGQCVRPKRPSSVEKGNTHSLPAVPVKIEVSADYGTVKDALAPESDYALVDDALPKSRIIHIKSNKEKNGSDSVKVECSTLEQDKHIYSEVICKRAPHKTSHQHQNEGEINVEHRRRSSDTERLTEHARERSHSPSQDSTGSRASLQTNMKSPGSYTHLSDSDVMSISSQLGLALMNEDDDVLSASNVSIHTVGSEYISTDISECANLNTLSKKKAGKDPMKTLERNKDEERRRQRENEKKQKEQQKLQKKVKKKDKTAGPSENGLSLGDFAMSPNNPSLPQFIEKCVEFIEAEGLHVEGIYRIPGNKPLAESLRAKFAEDVVADISRDEMPLTAVATAFKELFAHLADPLVPVSLYTELMDTSERTKEYNNQGEQKKKERAMALRRVFLKMPPLNFEVLKFLVTHLNKVSQNCAKNSMNSTNLSVCWWPTLFRMEWDTFEKMSEFSRIPLEILSTLIEQCNSIFYCSYSIFD